MMIGSRTVCRTPLRILHVVRQFLPTHGGLEAYVTNLCTQQQAQGLAPSVLTLDRMFHHREVTLPRRETIDGIAVRRISFLGGRRLFLPLLTWRQLSLFDIVHVHGIDPLCDAVCMAKPMFGRPIVLTTHGGFFHTPDYALAKQIWFHTISRATLGRADAVIACSTNDQAMLARIGIPARVIANAVRPLPPRDPAGCDMLYLGRLAPNKRVDLLLSFAACLPEGEATPRLHIVGEDHDGTREQLRRRVRALGLDHRVMIHGYLAPEDLARIVGGCRFFVSASRYEGFGMSLVEAMTAGLLPFVHANAAFRELLADAGAGALADFDNPERCASQFIAWRATLDSPAHERARRFGMRFSWETLSDDVLAIYRTLLAQGPGNGRVEEMSAAQ